jgi:hypothetical protein
MKNELFKYSMCKDGPLASRTTKLNWLQVGWLPETHLSASVLRTERRLQKVSYQ